MRILHLCSEIYPLLKTGGLADVTAALPVAQSALGADVRVLLPAFPAIREGIKEQKLVSKLPPRFGINAMRLIEGILPNGLCAYLIDAPALYERVGNPYVDQNGQAYGDNYRRFALLAWAAARLADGLDRHWRPQIVHGHDWHTGLMPAYLKALEYSTGHRLAGSVFTIHNLAYQGVFPQHIFSELGLPEHFYEIHGVEYYNQVSFLKTGLFFSDKISTVSPTYAQEIQRREQGCGLDGLLYQRKADLLGILNGVDADIWNPATDQTIAACYDSDTIHGKRKCKSSLQRESGLTVQNDAPLFAVVSRLTEQKGLQLVLAGLPELIRRGGQLALLGSGDHGLENAFRAAASAAPQSVSVQIGYDETLSHRLIAGSDVILVPSRFEPCGLTQLYGLQYGTLPLVHRVGGLADTVQDCALENLADGSATGFAFESFTENAFNAAIRRVFALYDRKTDWKNVQNSAMAKKFGWEGPARQMLDLYQKIPL